MIEIKQYKCGKCGTVFDTLEECEAHEKTCENTQIISVGFFYHPSLFAGKPSHWEVLVNKHTGVPVNKPYCVSFGEEYWGHFDASIDVDKAIETVKQYLIEDMMTRAKLAETPVPETASKGAKCTL